jgi:mycothiol synthase
VTKSFTTDSVRALAADVEQRDGSPPLSDQALSRISAPGVREFVRFDGDTVIAYAQLDGQSLEIAAPAELVDDLLSEAEAVRPTLEVWSHGRRSAVATVARERGYREIKRLLQLRRPDAPIPSYEVPGGVWIRPFIPGHDEQNWLELNAAAFAGWGEQADIGLNDLLAREHEPWFDPAGFLLAVPSSGEETLLGFHWTKVHADGVGEVYVLAVAPSTQGTGLGRALLLAGLERLSGRLVKLYVDDANTKAKRLYESYGFIEHDVDVQFQSPAP